MHLKLRRLVAPVDGVSTETARRLEDGLVASEQDSRSTRHEQRRRAAQDSRGYEASSGAAVASLMAVEANGSGDGAATGFGEEASEMAGSEARATVELRSDF